MEPETAGRGRAEGCGEGRAGSGGTRGPPRAFPCGSDGKRNGGEWRTGGRGRAAPHPAHRLCFLSSRRRRAEGRGNESGSAPSGTEQRSSDRGVVPTPGVVPTRTSAPCKARALQPPVPQSSPTHPLPWLSAPKTGIPRAGCGSYPLDASPSRAQPLPTPGGPRRTPHSSRSGCRSRSAPQGGSAWAALHAAGGVKLTGMKPQDLSHGDWML